MDGLGVPLIEKKSIEGDKSRQSSICQQRRINFFLHRDFVFWSCAVCEIPTDITVHLISYHAIEAETPTMDDEDVPQVRIGTFSWRSPLVSLPKNLLIKFLRG